MSNYQVPGIPSQQDVNNVMTVNQKTELDAKMIAPTKKMASENPFEFNPEHLADGVGYQYINFRAVNIMELFVPMAYYIRNAKGFGQMDFRKGLNLCPNSITVIEVMGWINEQVMKEGNGGISYFTVEFLPMRFDYDDREESLKLKNQKHGTNNNNNNNNEIDEPMEDENNTINNININNHIVDPNEIKDWKNLTEEQFERLGRKFAGMRFRLSLYKPEKEQLPFYLEALFKQNEERMKKKASRGWRGGASSEEKQLSIFDLTFEKWKRVVCILEVGGYNIDNINSSVVFPTSPFNPTVAFAPTLSTQKAIQFGAIEPCGDVTEYVERIDNDYSNGVLMNTIKQYTFPYKGRWTYRINSQDTHYTNWRKCYFPYIKRNKYTETPEILMMRKLISSENIPGKCLVMGLETSGITVPPLEGEIEDSEDENFQGISKVGRGTTMYRNKSVENAALYASCTQQEHEMTMEHFKELTAAKFHELTLKHKNRIGSLSYSREVVRLRRKCIWEFENHMWQQDAAVSDSMKSIIEYSNEYLRHFKNYSLPVKHICKNLSPLADAITQFQIALETIFNVRSVHKDVVVCMLTVWQIYMRTPFHAHMLLVGPAKAGKSFMFQLAMMLLIKGTYKALSYVTPKAKAGFADTPFKIDCMIEFFEEMLAQHLGVGKNESQKSVAGNANSDVESLIKNWLTTGKISFQRTIMVNNMPVVQEAEISCNSIMMAAANISALELPDPMASRFNIVNCQIKDRVDSIEQERVDLRSYIKPSSEANLAYEAITYRMKRNQMLIAYISSLIYVGVLPQPNMTAGVFTILGALRLASKYLLKNTTDARNIQRLEFLLTSLILWRAIVIVFDSMISPIKDKTWEADHILHVIPYLYSTTEDASIVIGLLAQQFEDTLSQNILKHLAEYVLMNDVSTMSIQRPIDVNDPSQPLLIWSSMPPPPQQHKKKRLHRKQPTEIAKEVINAIVPHLDSINCIKQSYINEPDPVAITNNDDDNAEDEKRLEVNHLSPEGYITAKVPGDTLKSLGQTIHLSMNPRPTLLDVTETFKRLSEQSHPYQEYTAIKIDPITKQPVYGLMTKKDYILKYNHTATNSNNGRESGLSNTIQLSKNVIKHSLGKSQRRLMKCVEETVCHPHARQNNILYGENRSDLFYISNVIRVVITTVDKKGQPAQPMRILNPTYFNALLKKITHGSLDNIYHSFRGGKKPVINLNTVFSNEEGIELDSDLNDYAVDQFNAQNHFTDEELKYQKPFADADYELPFNHPLIIHREIKKLHSEPELQKMMIYPNEIINEHKDQKKFNEINEQSKINKDGNVRFTSSKAESARLRAKRKAEQAIEMDEKYNESKQQNQLSLNLLIRTQTSESRYLDENTRSSSSGSNNNNNNTPIVLNPANSYLIDPFFAEQVDNDEDDDDDFDDENNTSYADNSIDDNEFDISNLQISEDQLNADGIRALETVEAQIQQQQQNNNDNNNTVNNNIEYETNEEEEGQENMQIEGDENDYEIESIF